MAPAQGPLRCPALRCAPFTRALTFLCLCLQIQIQVHVSKGDLKEFQRSCWKPIGSSSTQGDFSIS